MAEKLRNTVLLIKEIVQKDIDALPDNYKTGDIDRLISDYVRMHANPAPLRDYILSEQQFHRIYFYVALKQMKTATERAAFIHSNLLFSDWWHTDQLIRFVSKLDFESAYFYAKDYVNDPDPFIRRWGYVLFISPLCRNHASDILPLMHNDAHYYVQMAEAWLIAELAVFETETIYEWLQHNNLSYDINGKAIQKISDSFRISDEWKERFRKLRKNLK